MSSTKQVTLTQFLTDSEIDLAIELFKKLNGTGTFAKTVDAEIITPNLDRINRSLDQQNDPRYLAYAVEYVLMESSKPHPPTQ